MSNIEVSIITVGYRSQATLFALLQSILQQIGCSVEFVYVEHSPEFSSSAIIKEHYPDAIIIEPGENLGFSKGCNLGAAVAKGDYLLFLNPDCEIKTKDTLKKMIQFMEDHPTVGICAPMYVSPEGKIFSSAHFKYFGEQYIASKFTHLPGQIAFVIGAALMISKDLYKTVKGFDEDYFMYSEDVEICLRVRQLNYVILEVPGTQMLHLGGHSSRQRWRKAALVTRLELSHAIFTGKHYFFDEQKTIWKRYRAKRFCKLIKSCLVHPHRIGIYWAIFCSADVIFRKIKK